MLQSGLRFSDLTWLDLRAWVRHCAPGSALRREIDPEWWVTPELRFLRDIADGIEWLQWSKTKDAQHNTNRPRRTALTEAERRAMNPDYGNYTPLPYAEMLAWLGWTTPKEA